MSYSITLAGPLPAAPVGIGLAALTAGADGSTMETRAANRSPRNLIASVTLVLEESGRYGDDSDADNTPMVAATIGQGFRHSAGSRYLSAVSAAANSTGINWSGGGTATGW